MKNKLLSFAIACCLSTPVFAGSKFHTKNETYTVKKGDTLWSISNSFLGNPYYWPELWKVNNQIDNPHLIYPGDVLRIVYDKKEGKYLLKVVRMKHEIWSPKQKVKETSPYLKPVNFEVINKEIGKYRIFDSQMEVNASSYSKIISGVDGRENLSEGDHVFIKKGNLISKGSTLYINTIPHKINSNGQVYYESEQIGKLTVIKEHQNSWEAVLNETTKEARPNDWLSVDHISFPKRYFPHKNSIKEAKILEIHQGKHYTGAYDSILINKGFSQGVAEGDVFSIENKYKSQPDSFTKGAAIVYKTYGDLSYALIYNSNMQIKIGDKLK